MTWTWDILSHKCWEWVSIPVELPRPQMGWAILSVGSNFWGSQSDTHPVVHIGTVGLLPCLRISQRDIVTEYEMIMIMASYHFYGNRCTESTKRQTQIPSIFGTLHFQALQPALVDVSCILYSRPNKWDDGPNWLSYFPWGSSTTNQWMFIQYFGFLLITVPPMLTLVTVISLAPWLYHALSLYNDISGSLLCFVFSHLWGWLKHHPPPTTTAAATATTLQCFACSFQLHRFPSRSSLHGMDGFLAAGNSRGRLVAGGTWGIRMMVTGLVEGKTIA